jgi:hypothetical protein
LEGQIEQVKGQMQYYEGRAAFSTISVDLNPQRPTPIPTPTPTPVVWSPGATFTSASGVLVNLVQKAVDGLIWLVVVLGPFILMLVLLYWAIRKLGRLQVR